MTLSSETSRLATSDALRANLGLNARVATAVCACALLLAWVDLNVLLVWLTLVAFQDFVFAPWVQRHWVLPVEIQDPKRADDAALITLITGTIIYSALAPIAWFLGGEVGRILAVLWMFSSILHSVAYYGHRRRAMIVTAAPHLTLMVLLPTLTGGFNWSSVATSIVMLQIVAISAAAFLQRRSMLDKVNRYRKAKEEADEANSAKSRFLAVVSHELRTPINAIIGYADLIREDMSERGELAGVEDATKIATAAQRLKELVDDVLDMSNLEAKSVSATVVETNVENLILEVVNDAKEMIAERHNSVRVSVASDINTIETDPAHLRRCLKILLSNACKFTYEGIVTVSAQRVSRGGASSICISVSDTGIGMDAPQLEKAFAPFTQGDDSTTRKFGGTGLGLAIAKHLSTLLKGDIEVTSRSGAGTTFSLALPGH